MRRSLLTTQYTTFKLGRKPPTGLLAAPSIVEVSLYISHSLTVYSWEEAGESEIVRSKTLASRPTDNNWKSDHCGCLVAVLGLSAGQRNWDSAEKIIKGR